MDIGDAGSSTSVGITTPIKMFKLNLRGTGRIQITAPLSNSIRINWGEYGVSYVPRGGTLRWAPHVRFKEMIRLARR